MPELPEVETTRRGVAPHLLGHQVLHIEIRDPRLRWPIPLDLPERLVGRTIRAVDRRGKYLLFRTDDEGCLLVHLGMSGSLRIAPEGTPLKKHDHVEIRLTGGTRLRFHDPRRFGCILWVTGDPMDHTLLVGLGPEPFETAFDGRHLFEFSRGKSAAVKTMLMDSHCVVGVGNIYANEALFRSGIHPARPAGRIGAARYHRLADSVREVLGEAITQGGTTLRDFVNESGKPGYFQQTLRVYDRAGEPCRRCNTPIKLLRLGQRATYFCPRCQR